MQLYENFEPYLGLLVVFAAIFCSQQNVLLNMRYKKKFRADIKFLEIVVF